MLQADPCAEAGLQSGKRTLAAADSVFGHSLRYMAGTPHTFQIEQPIPQRAQIQYLQKHGHIALSLPTYGQQLGCSEARRHRPLLAQRSAGHQAPRRGAAGADGAVPGNGQGGCGLDQHGGQLGRVLGVLGQPVPCPARACRDHNLQVKWRKRSCCAACGPCNDLTVDFQAAFSVSGQFSFAVCLMMLMGAAAKRTGGWVVRTHAATELGLGPYFCSASSMVMPGADVLVAARAATTLPAADQVLSCSC